MQASIIAQDLEDFQWKNRVLLLVEKQAAMLKTREQISDFKAFQKEMTERKLLLLVYDGNVLRDHELKVISTKNKKNKSISNEGVYLVGMDGGIKLAEPFFVKPSKVFELIDSMPMRRVEIRSKNKP
jgi:hypothetical protein